MVYKDEIISTLMHSFKNLSIYSIFIENRISVQEYVALYITHPQTPIYFLMCNMYYLKIRVMSIKSINKYS